MRQTLWLFCLCLQITILNGMGVTGQIEGKVSRGTLDIFHYLILGLFVIFLFRAVFNWLSKVIKVCISFSLLRSVIGPENSCNSLNQSYAKQKPISTWSPAFSRAWEVFIVLPWVLIGSLEYCLLIWLVVVITFSLVSRHPIEKRSVALIWLTLGNFSPGWIGLYCCDVYSSCSCYLNLSLYSPTADVASLFTTEWRLYPGKIDIL